MSRLPKTNQSEDKLVADIVEFFAQRSKNMMLDRGVRYDIVDAVLGAEGRDDLCDAFAAADALTAYLGTDKAPETLQAFTRVENITKKSRVDAPVSEALLREDAEKASLKLWKRLLKTYMECFFPVILPASLPLATAFCTHQPFL